MFGVQNITFIIKKTREPHDKTVSAKKSHYTSAKAIKALILSPTSGSPPLYPCHCADVY